LAGLKAEGYSPSPEVLKQLKSSVPVQAMIAVQKIFGLPMESKGLDSIKLAQGNNKEPLKDKSNELNI
ncbi:nucleotidyl transferase AbiEii/AbiGii toxin family protein, partial [Bacteroides sp. MSK.18.22]|nr:nucleotidyl transferase AbiEii/AbiGii toxin family protein [Bacteroides sp. MSK.18.22]